MKILKFLTADGLRWALAHEDEEGSLLRPRFVRTRSGEVATVPELAHAGRAVRTGAILAPRDYPVMQLREEEELTFREIGEAMGYSTSNANIIYHRAKNAERWKRVWDPKRRGYYDAR